MSVYSPSCLYDIHCSDCPVYSSRHPYFRCALDCTYTLLILESMPGNHLDELVFVEGCHSWPCLHPDCLLLAVGCSSKCIDLVMCVSGRLV